MRLNLKMAACLSGILILQAACYKSIGGETELDSHTDPIVDSVSDVVPDPLPDTSPPDVIPDAVPDVGTRCVTDDDCTVVIMQDRCCMPDPIAVPRALVGSDPCFHELGATWEDNPGCMPMECAWCPPISSRAYGAACVDGECVAVEDFCGGEIPEPAASLDANVEPSGGWGQYRGRVVQVTGYPGPGPWSCDCGYGGDCDCRSEVVQQTLDCGISLRGSVCGVPYECTGTECDMDCSPRILSNRGTFTGYLVDSEHDGFELWIMSDDDDCPPDGLNAEGETCTPLGDDDCMEGLYCFYWGDILDDCLGTCRPWGTECTTDTQCGEGEVCYMGYCEWCCPG
jgi:Cys-rich repeat protein